MTRKIYDVVATVGVYKDKNGQEKKRYQNVGAVFQGDKGMSMKLECVPVGKDWSGWLSFYEPKARDGAPAESGKPAAAATGDAGFNDDIPF